MTLPIPAFLRHHGRLVLIAGFGLLLALQAALHAPLIMRDAPYEGWDEVTTYNGARVLTGPTAHWAYRYGTLDTLLQLAALDYFQTFDPAGAEYRHIAYANNDPGSLNDEFYAFRGIQQDDVGYAYFRGIDDHRPITLSRGLHFAAFYGLAALAGLLWIWLLGVEAIWLLLPMLCLTLGTEVFLQAAFSLPNAINAMLSFGIVASLCLARALDRPRLFYLAAALLAVALNFKIDMLPLGFVLGLALLLQDRRAGLRPVLRRCLAAGAIFVGTLIATDPLLIVDPTAALRFLLPPVHQAAGNTGAAERFAGNLLPFARALKWDLLPEALQFWVPTIILPIALLSAAAIVVFLLRRRPALLRPLLLPVLAALLLWLPPLLLTQDYYERYVLNGVAALYALAGVALLGFWRSGDPTARRLAAMLALLLLGQYGVLARDGISQAGTVTAESMVLWGRGNSGWSQAQTRNIVEWRAVETFLAGGYDRTVLVDQHAYLDLRPLRLAGLAPVFVNLDTLDQVLATLDPAAPHLLLYSTGNYAPDPAWWRPWMSRWSPETQRRYDAYRAVIDGFPVLHDTGGPAQRLLWTGPVGPSDRMILAAVPPVAIQRETR
jgi:hypothetical protein